MPTPLPCPFCGKQPEVTPHDIDGEIWAIVTCENQKCAAHPSVLDSRRINACKTTAAAAAAAIRRWNRRA